MLFNLTQFNKTVADAKRKAPQMAKQIDDVAETLLCNPFIADMDGGLLITSDKSQNIYFTRKGRCNCKAADFKRVCWHRLADRLVRLYNSRAGH